MRRPLARAPGCRIRQSATGRSDSGRTENAAADRSGDAFAPVRVDGGTVTGMWTRTERVMIGTIRRTLPADAETLLTAAEKLSQS